ncbi:hypothetical protein N7532_004067 [Penicillium argentinense]|uniref:Methyltransferase n=1 Tax=Penicillium argentinense TaxID=1131581 RepID=A0A9W9FNN7_9EURO|nr:uncharacterized protein N7532_004067 [Penicillium argentinense]KAJ5103538.1 hypothetical protein N7532_004067 [Penicillium argentinense]
MSTTTTTTETAPSYIPRGPTKAELTFYAPPTDGTNEPQRNYLEHTQNVSLTDIRGSEQNFNLDKDAFQALSQIPTKTTYDTFDSDAAVREIYYPEVESLLLTHVPGAHKIVLFDHTIRRQKEGAPRQPVNRAHVDQTPRAAADRVRLHVSDPEEAEKLLAGRYRIINVWRPLTSEPVQSAPLAFASAQSVDGNDLVPIQHRYPNRTGETMGVKYNPDQEWHYWSGMTSDEWLLLKCSDSEGLKGGEVKQWVPHSAFWDPRTPEGARVRESIEVRALVFG